ncbi:hypothetical protein HPB51_017509 [Rhipicephalus microplus]|uniref:Uncharacterized protein n=1 Tax=Rhipicephalus microplus TaxID=6941 RepID=A0A9J6F4S1_RHIMP|nr:hypothetical protein HPB51_017509 [Rhipicephalus microplus]
MCKGTTPRDLESGMRTRPTSRCTLAKVRPATMSTFSILYRALISESEAHFPTWLPNRNSGTPCKRRRPFRRQRGSTSPRCARLCAARRTTPGRRLAGASATNPARWPAWLLTSKGVLRCAVAADLPVAETIVPMPWTQLRCGSPTPRSRAALPRARAASETLKASCATCANARRAANATSNWY